MIRPVMFVSVAALVALATAAVVAAGDGKEQIRLNPADQAAARAVVIRRSDLGTTGWQGGSVKPDLSGPSCPNFHPKLSDLVITGVAEADFRRGGFVFGSAGEVLKTRRMVALDWHRSVLARGAVSCLRTTMRNGLGTTAKVISFAKLPFPRLATYTAFFRAVIGVPTQGRTVRLLADIVLVGRGRTELTLSVVGPAAAKTGISAAERRLARALISRARV